MDRSRAVSVLRSVTPMPPRWSVWLKPRAPLAPSAFVPPLAAYSWSSGLRKRRRPLSSSLAEALGFIVAANDPRRHIVACAGAPICSSAHIAARALAPRIAEILAGHIDGARQRSHFGMRQGLRTRLQRSADYCRLTRRVRADCQWLGARIPFAVIATDELPVAIENYFHEKVREDSHV